MLLLQNHFPQHPWPPDPLGGRVRSRVPPPERHPWPAERGVLPGDTSCRLLRARLALPEWQDDQTMPQHMWGTEEGLCACLWGHQNGVALLPWLWPLLCQRTWGLFWSAGRTERYKSHLRVVLLGTMHTLCCCVKPAPCHYLSKSWSYLLQRDRSWKGPASLLKSPAPSYSSPTHPMPRCTVCWRGQRPSAPISLMSTVLGVALRAGTFWLSSSQTIQGSTSYVSK